MIKLVYCITKKPGLTDEEFFHHWKNVHDGIAELWFDSEEALLAARQSREWKASREDEANFIDPGKVAYFVSDEHTILSPAR